jgi:hypothetical protein
LSTSFGTTIDAPDFAGLVNRADDIVHARVVQVSSFKDDYRGRPLVRTEVTFEVEESLMGVVNESALTLRFLGGRVEDLVMQVDGMPTFRRGEEVVLFVQGQGRQVCPLVGWGHGKLLIQRDAVDGPSRVLRINGEPLRGTQQIGTPFATMRPVQALSEVASSTRAALTLESLLEAVREVREGKARHE